MTDARQTITTTENGKKVVTITDQHGEQKLSLRFKVVNGNADLSENNEAITTALSSLNASMDHLLGMELDDVRREYPWALAQNAPTALIVETAPPPPQTPQIDPAAPAPSPSGPMTMPDIHPLRVGK